MTALQARLAEDFLYLHVKEVLGVDGPDDDGRIGPAPGAGVIVVEDVVTTAAATIKACERAKEFVLVPVHAIALVDRMEGGREAIAQLFPTTPLTTLYNRNNFL